MHSGPLKLHISCWMSLWPLTQWNHFFVLYFRAMGLSVWELPEGERGRGGTSFLSCQLVSVSYPACISSPWFPQPRHHKILSSASFTSLTHWLVNFGVLSFFCHFFSLPSPCVHSSLTWFLWRPTTCASHVCDLNTVLEIHFVKFEVETIKYH